MNNEFGINETYEAMVADVRPKFKKTGCSDREARQAMKGCPLLIRYALPDGEDNAHKCPWCGGRIYPVAKVEKCGLCGYPYTTDYDRDARIRE